MNQQQIDETCRNTEYWSVENRLAELRNMVVSCYAYGADVSMDNKYLKKYVMEKDDIEKGVVLTYQMVKDTIKDQLDYMKKHCFVACNVGTDGEGVSYNSVKWF